MTTATITAICSLVGIIISGIVSLIVSGRQSDKTIALIEYRLDKIEAKADKHNKIQDRVLQLEMNDKAQWKWIDEFKEENH